MCPILRYRRSASSSAPRGIAAPPSNRASTNGMFSPSVRPFAGIENGRASMVRCFSASTRTRSRCRRAPARSRCWPPTASRSCSPRTTNTRRRPRCRTRSSVQPRPHRGAGRRHRRHAFAQSAGRRRLQVQPAERGTGGCHGHRLDRSHGEQTSRTQVSRVCGGARVKALRAATTHRHDFLRATSAISAT